MIADESSNPSFVAADLLSQAEHGVDSQVVLIGINLTPKHLSAIEDEVDKQAHQLPRVDIVRKSIAKSLVVQASSIQEAMEFSNDYAPEHLIVNLAQTQGVLEMVENAGSVFIGQYTPERYLGYSSDRLVIFSFVFTAVVTTHLVQIIHYLRTDLQDSIAV